MTQQQWDVVEQIAELPDSIRVPLHSLQADVGYLIGRVQADGSCGGAIAASITSRLIAIEMEVRTLLSSSRGEQGWRTIDSAPKDGTFIDIWAVNPAGRRYTRVRWHDPEVEIGAVSGPAWRDWQHVPVIDHADAVPTHWMPLPSAPGSVPTSLAGQGTDPEEYRSTFSGIVQGGCEECGNCSDDENGECACDRIVNELIAAVERINEEAAPQPTAGGDAP